MLYRSLTDSSIQRDFAQAVIEGLAPDKGLYYPERIPQLPKEFWLSEEDLQPWHFGAAMMAPLAAPVLTEADLTDILQDVLNFPLDLHKIENNVYALELFHGPTHAFKDVGARFLSRVLGRVSDKRLTVLVATSGDTGSAVAQGFLNVPNIDVVILYPQGRISKIQEQQLTTAGANIKALEVKGAFDDCQAMVKAAFLDNDLQTQRPLTSANWIHSKINNVLKSLIDLKNIKENNSSIKALAYQLYENNGVLKRDQVSEYLKNLEQNERKILRDLGVKFGRYHVFLYQLIKPEAVSLRTLLWKNFYQKFHNLKPPTFGLNFLDDKEIKNKNFMLLCGFE
ncbi:MAG: hypothetical protein ACPH97_02645, partial [Flavobacteriales bacterium]